MRLLKTPRNRSDCMADSLACSFRRETNRLFPPERYHSGIYLLLSTNGPARLGLRITTKDDNEINIIFWKKRGKRPSRRYRSACRTIWRTTSLSGERATCSSPFNLFLSLVVLRSGVSTPASAPVQPSRRSSGQPPCSRG